MLSGLVACAIFSVGASCGSAVAGSLRVDPACKCRWHVFCSIGVLGYGFSRFRVERRV